MQSDSIFFIGGKEKGYLLLQQLLGENEKIVGACVMNEDEHEQEKFCDKIIEFLSAKNIPYLSKNRISKPTDIEFIKNTNPSVIVVFGWRTKLPEEVLRIPKVGCVAVHESLLPHYRGFAPINWAIINGEKKTGATLFFIESEIDSGDIISQDKISIQENDLASEVATKMNKVSLTLIQKYLPMIKAGTAPRRKQDETQATYTCTRIPSDGQINWSNSTEKIYNLIRGLSHPYSGAYTNLLKDKIIILKARVPAQIKYVGRIPGRVVRIIKREGIEILTGDGIIFIEKIKVNNAEPIEPSLMIKSLRTTFGTECP